MSEESNAGVSSKAVSVTSAYTTSVEALGENLGMIKLGDDVDSDDSRYRCHPHSPGSQCQQPFPLKPR